MKVFNSHRKLLIASASGAVAIAAAVGVAHAKPSRDVMTLAAAVRSLTPSGDHVRFAPGVAASQKVSLPQGMPRQEMLHYLLARRGLTELSSRAGSIVIQGTPQRLTPSPEAPVAAPIKTISSPGFSLTMASAPPVAAHVITPTIVATTHPPAVDHPKSLVKILTDVSKTQKARPALARVTVHHTVPPHASPGAPPALTDVLAPVPAAPPGATAGGSWVATSGNTMAGVLNEWAKSAGWSVRYESDVMYPIAASAVFRGNFLSAVRQLVYSIRANPSPIIHAYGGNRVIVVKSQGRD